MKWEQILIEVKDNMKCPLFQLRRLIGLDARKVLLTPIVFVFIVERTAHTRYAKVASF